MLIKLGMFVRNLEEGSSFEVRSTIIEGESDELDVIILLVKDLMFFHFRLLPPRLERGLHGLELGIH